MYHVVYPLGRLTQVAKAVPARLKTLDGMTIGELSNHKFGSELTLEVLEKALLKRYPNIKFIHHENFGDTYGPAESDVIKAIPERLREFKCDAVISGNGG